MSATECPESDLTKLRKAALAVETDRQEAKDRPVPERPPEPVYELDVIARVVATRTTTTVTVAIHGMPFGPFPIDELSELGSVIQRAVDLAGRRALFGVP